MTTIQLTRLDFSEPPALKRPIVPAVFQPLDPTVLNASIPAFFIGRDKDGFWLARDVRGRAGGIFLLESSALAFARRHSRPLPCATIFPSEPFELDLENRGNLLIPRIRPLLRIFRLIQRKLGQAIERGLRRLHAP
jgi:hypothetical protein